MDRVEIIILVAVLLEVMVNLFRTPAALYSLNESSFEKEALRLPIVTTYTVLVRMKNLTIFGKVFLTILAIIVDLLSLPISLLLWLIIYGGFFLKNICVKKGVE